MARSWLRERQRASFLDDGHDRDVSGARIARLRRDPVRRRLGRRHAGDGRPLHDRDGARRQRPHYVPDYPAEIRAPAGTTYGVSAFQIHFGAVDVMTPGDQVDVLVAMNPAALKVDLK